MLSWFLCLLGSLLGCSTSKHAILATPKGFFTAHPSLHHLFPFLFSFLDSTGPVQQMSQGNKKNVCFSLLQTLTVFTSDSFGTPPLLLPFVSAGRKSTYLQSPQGWTDNSFTPKTWHSQGWSLLPVLPQYESPVWWLDWFSGLVLVRTPVERWLVLTSGSFLNLKDGALGPC